jgi:hypothetical protein
MGTPWQHSVAAEHISTAFQYVVAEQGEAMSVFESHEL